MRYTTKETKAFLEPREMPSLGHPNAWVSYPVDTGLVDANGARIYRLPDSVGFVRFGEK